MRLELETRRFYLGRDYSETIERAGGIPLHLGLIPKREYVAEALAGVDGVLLPGSNTDVDPAFYGEEPHHRLGIVIPEKDETDRLILDEVERVNKPLLAICYGMQALNVARGGTLIQDIESQMGTSIKHEQGEPFARPSHSLKIAADGVLSAIARTIDRDDSLRVNSSHHQAVKDLGRDLRPVAWASDGVVEAVEDTRPERFVLGVQWHPELGGDRDRLSSGLFARFVEACSSNHST